jgi:hypothetical protein
MDRDLCREDFERRPERVNVNRGIIIYPEKQPAEPLSSEAARMLSHGGGLVSARNVHY